QVLRSLDRMVVLVSQPHGFLLPPSIQGRPIDSNDAATTGADARLFRQVESDFEICNRAAVEIPVPMRRSRRDHHDVAPGDMTAHAAVDGRACRAAASRRLTDD